MDANFAGLEFGLHLRQAIKEGITNRGEVDFPPAGQGKKGLEMLAAEAARSDEGVGNGCVQGAMIPDKSAGVIRRRTRYSGVLPKDQGLMTLTLLIQGPGLSDAVIFLRARPFHSSVDSMGMSTVASSFFAASAGISSFFTSGSPAGRLM